MRQTLTNTFSSRLPGGYDLDLSKAVAYGMTDTVRRILDEGTPDLNATGSYDYTALTIAAGHGDIEIVKLLLNAGADVNAIGNYGQTALILAAQDAHLDVVRLLLNAGANVDAQNTFGETALIMAILGYGNNLDVVRLLLDRGADVELTNDQGKTALTLATELNEDKIAESIRNRIGLAELFRGRRLPIRVQTFMKGFL